MKNILSIFLVLLTLLSAGVSFAQKTPKVELASKAREILDKKYPGWKFPKVDESIREYFKKSDVELNLVQGDFDGNRQTDYALQIEHGVEFDSGGHARPKIHLIALLQKAGKYKFYILDAEPGRHDFIALWKKGEQGYSFETHKKFTFVNDAVEAIYYEKAAVSYIFEKGRFRLIVTRD
jgi:hypothetical protein